jgi:hypothetical protein
MCTQKHVSERREATRIDTLLYGGSHGAMGARFAPLWWGQMMYLWDAS